MNGAWISALMRSAAVYAYHAIYQISVSDPVYIISGELYAAKFSQHMRLLLGNLDPSPSLQHASDIAAQCISRRLS